MDNEKVYICLENGKTFEGRRFGAGRDVTGELVFTTGMCGYIETLTDPSYYGQIVLQTFPLIGNYGFIDNDAESDKSSVTAYIVRENATILLTSDATEHLTNILKQTTYRVCMVLTQGR